MKGRDPKMFDDDGSEVNPNLIRKPSLCTTCQKDGNPAEEPLCQLNRPDQAEEDDFQCDAYLPHGAPPESEQDDDVIHF